MPHTDIDPSEAELRFLRVYRRAAGKVFDRLGPWAGHKFEANILRADGYDTATLIPDTAFTALLTAFRLTYADREDPHFGRIANILWRVGDSEVRRLVGLLREDWKRVLHRPFLFDLHGEDFRPASLLDTWLNGDVFHLDDELLHRVDLLRGAGPVPLMVLQLTVRDLCFPLLGLDNVCALVLGEPLRALPDITTTSNGDLVAG